MQVTINTPTGQITLPDRAGLPRTSAELEGLRMQRAELQSQVEALQASRSSLSQTIDRMGDSPGRAALQLRVAEVDQRILQIERQIDGINERIANASPRVMVGRVEPPRRSMADQVAGNIVPLTAILSVFVLFPIALALARLMWKRATAIGERPAINEQLIVGRMDQLQTSLDAMALEVERISEGQRYVTKLMSEKDKAALPRSPISS